jgi:hypothetical protein
MVAIRRQTPAGLIPAGFQVLSLANSTAVGLNSTLRPCTTLDISVEGGNARYRADATAPTKTTGVLIKSSSYVRLTGYNNTSNLKFQRSTSTVTVKVQVQGYKVVGDK